MTQISTLFRPTVLLALALMAVIVMMILPVPAIILDIGLAASFALAILIFTVTLFIERPLDFSAFPTVLLASLMLRLALNVSSTKLIIGQGHTGTGAAGQVIEGFAYFVMGGSVLLGLVVFSVLLIVNFVVINKGATRMAEVGARFALDAMPGKQLAIDADMSAGAIDHAEARHRREVEQAETTFFGSLDGASKFVKGDAVAGLLITGLNLVMGMIIGTALHGMPIGKALETYAILTVGDGLVSQIPAVVISIASALLLARGGSKGATDIALVGQLGKHPAALATVAMLMLLFAFVPGLPFIPFIVGAGVLGACAYFARSKPAEPDAPEENLPAPEASLGDMLDLDDIHVEFAPDLIEMVLDPVTGLDARIVSMRQHVATRYGLILPEIRMTDSAMLPDGHYAIRIQGVEQATDQLRPGRILALLPDGTNPPVSGETVTEPVYGAPARWIAPQDQDTALIEGLTTVLPNEVLATHLLEIIKRNFPRLMSQRALARILDEMVNLSDGTRREANKRLLNDMIPDRVPTDLLLSVLRLLLEEQVSIRNLPLILEAISEGRATYGTPEMLTEYVRQRLGFQIIAEYKRSDGTLPLIQLAQEWEDTFTRYQIAGERADVALPPDVFNQLGTSIAEKASEIAGNGVQAAIVTNARRRRFLRTILTARGVSNPVISFEEIGLSAKPALVGLVPA
ncbi:flagellar biosynthesis protein FlhA [Marivivens donghaensis]|uniref:Flagellar biosynthesis protein FlhA n=1 Tax=Marivivens donghaensis TaxID=1699413 RepID=A0ABX0VZ01_9RHOB|nr:flagellar biosynthesis protein FlhA [Marivivens donghaensis]NIY73311.1 flagellar biosynthesis protein FlhA [Marivivens donghaensis]